MTSREKSPGDMPAVQRSRQELGRAILHVVRFGTFTASQGRALSWHMAIPETNPHFSPAEMERFLYSIGVLVEHRRAGVSLRTEGPKRGKESGLLSLAVGSMKMSRTPKSRKELLDEEVIKRLAVDKKVDKNVILDKLVESDIYWL